MTSYEAVVVGSGPNGLAAAIALTGSGHSVLVVESAPTPGGGARTAELTLPGCRHDVCSAVHPFGVASPFFRSLPLEKHGLRWIHHPIPMAHPLDDGAAVLLQSSLDATADSLGGDGPAYRRWVGNVVRHWDDLESLLMGPLLRMPRHPIAAATFGLPALLPATRFARLAFRTHRARALFAGAAAHAIQPLERPATASFGLVFLAAGHKHGWPIAAGGSQMITTALVDHLRSLGGEVVVGTQVRNLTDLPPSKAILFDTSPAGMERIVGDRFNEAFRRKLRRFRYGPGAFKVDLALDGPVPWANPSVGRAGTVHLGGTLDQVAASERGADVERHFVLLAQPTGADPTRAPAGKHIVWAYCHVPPSSTLDMTAAIEGQIERFAPGFSRLILARHARDPKGFESYNPNYVGGDIAAGAATLMQLVRRPVLSADPYATPDPTIFLCSSSTPPGPGVHGMCGYHAAQSALKRLRSR